MLFEVPLLPSSAVGVDFIRMHYDGHTLPTDMSKTSHSLEC